MRRRVPVRQPARQRLAEIRGELGLSQELMAEALGTTLRTYQRWESGEVKRLTVDTMQDAEALLVDRPNPRGLLDAVRRKK